MSHTPTPWSIAQSSNPKNGTAWRDLRAVGDFGEMYIGEALDKDAAHIIRCVNTHDQLVAALRLVDEKLGHKFNSELSDIVDEALAAAEKGA